MKDIYASQIKRLKPANGFLVAGEKERAKAIKSAAELKKFGQIEFEVSSREVAPATFKIFAV